MRHLLIPVLLLGLIAGCSSTPIGPHRIDVQQGNALNPENVARLKPGLSRSQVRFLLGTPLLVDPFRTDRWDYVYVDYKAGKLAEQRRVTLFFEGDLLARIDGDLPEQMGMPAAATPAPAPAVAQAAAAVPQVQQTPLPETRTPARSAGSTDMPQNQHAEILRFLNAWADAWARRDAEAYFAAYDSSYIPPGGSSRVEWENSRRLLLGLAKKINIGIESPRVERARDGTVAVTFEQYYNADDYYDAVVKQLRMANRNGRWLIVEEQVLSVLREGQR